MASWKTSSWLSSLTFGWAGDLMKEGNQRILKDDDLVELSEQEESENLTEDLQTEWEKEKLRASENLRNPKLWRALVRATPRKDYLYLFVSALVESLCRVLQPVYLAYFLEELSRMPRGEHRWEQKGWALMYALLLCACALFMTFATHLYLFHSCRLGMTWRVAVAGVLYRKVLSINQKGIGQVTTGHVINLLSNDSQRFDEVFKYLLYVFLTPMEILITCIVLWLLIGVPSLAGLAFMVLVVPLSVGLGQLSGNLRKRTAERTDSRLSFINEVIAGIMTIKTSAWEEPIGKEIRKRRSQEMRIIRQKTAVVVVLEQMYKLSLILSSFISLVSMVRSGMTLTPVNVFTVLSFMVALRQSVSHYCASAIRLLFECSVSLRRIEKLLLHDEDTFTYQKYDIEMVKLKEELRSSFMLSPEKLNAGSHEKNLKHFALEAQNTTSTWNATNGNAIEEICLKIEKGSLTAITGPVGSGKSSLLMTLLRELPHKSGNVMTEGELAYTPQDPWVFSGTIRDNILFGLDFDSMFYTRVIRACALERDFKELPHGDLSIIGARGLTLSGGQRARVSLARAVYSRADIILLDDPLSKVDAIVGRHILTHCINGVLSGTTRLLVTHHLRDLKKADHVIVMEAGRILTQGTFAEIDVSTLKNYVTENNEICNGKRMDDNSNDLEETKDRPTKVVRPNMEEDDGIVGKIDWRTYYEYLRAGLPLVSLVALALLFCISQASYIMTDWWLALWTHLSPQQQRNDAPVLLYVGMIGITLLLAAIVTCLYFITLLRASQKLHQRLVHAVLRVPMHFFHVNPAGRILNRFSRDIGIMDEELPRLMFDGIQHSIYVIATVILVSVTNYWVIIAGIPLVYLCGRLSRYYLKTTMEVSRLEAVKRSPVYALFSTTLRGLVTIRTARMQERFMDDLYKYQNVHSRAWLALLGCNRWLALRLELISVSYTVCVAIASLLVSSDPAMAGLALTYAIPLGATIQWAVREITYIENKMISVERVLTYTKLNPEAGYDCRTLPPNGWPSRGALRLENVGLSYQDNTIPALKNISAVIPPGEKVGVVGRTGAGKSSLVAALFRIEEPTGNVVIDDFDNCSLNIQEARRAVSLVPQDPVLFSGTLRRSLDPLDKLSDAQIWKSLDEMQLKEFVCGLPGKLEFEITEAGNNLSCGQRQLICLMRATLQRNKILVMDEATANVDIHTDQVIHKTVATAFRNRTVICVAHRIHALLDYDRIIVIDKGRIVENGSPSELLDQHDSLFSRLYHSSTQHTK